MPSSRARVTRASRSASAASSSSRAARARSAAVARASARAPEPASSASGGVSDASGRGSPRGDGLMTSSGGLLRATARRVLRGDLGRRRMRVPLTFWRRVGDRHRGRRRRHWAPGQGEPAAGPTGPVATRHRDRSGHPARWRRLGRGSRGRCRVGWGRPGGGEVGLELGAGVAVGAGQASAAQPAAVADLGVEVAGGDVADGAAPPADTAPAPPDQRLVVGVVGPWGCSPPAGSIPSSSGACAGAGGGGRSPPRSPAGPPLGRRSAGSAVCSLARAAPGAAGSGADSTARR